MSNKSRRTFGGNGPLVQKSAMIGSLSGKRSADASFLEPSTAASPADSIASTTSRGEGPPSAKKRRTATPSLVPTHTPAETGQSMLAQLTFAVDYLKSKKGDPQTVDQITNYLSIRDEDRIKELVRSMRANPGIAHALPEVQGDRASSSLEEWRLGTYAYVAKLPGVRDKMSLLLFLQKRTDAMGVSVKDIKDGWPDCEKALKELEKETRVLVTRTKKDGQARMVWLDDPSLHHEVREDIKSKWHKVQLPSMDDMPRELKKEGLKASSEEPKAIKQVGQKDQRKKAARKSTKVTNTHLAGVLKDFSHMGRRAV